MSTDAATGPSSALRGKLAVLINIEALVTLSPKATKKQLIDGTVGNPQQRQITIDSKPHYAISRPFAGLVVDCLRSRCDEVQVFSTFDADTLEQILAKFAWDALPRTTVTDKPRGTEKRHFGAFEGFDATRCQRSVVIDVSDDAWSAWIRPQIVVADPGCWGGLLAAWSWTSRIADYWQGSGEEAVATVCDFARHTLLKDRSLVLARRKTARSHRVAMMASASGARLVPTAAVATHIIRGPTERRGHSSDTRDDDSDADDAAGPARLPASGAAVS